MLNLGILMGSISVMSTVTLYVICCCECYQNRGFRELWLYKYYECLSDVIVLGLDINVVNVLGYSVF